MVPNAVAAPFGETTVRESPMRSRYRLRQADADGDRIIAGELVKAAGDDVVADRRQRTQVVQRDAAHQRALRAAV